MDLIIWKLDQVTRTAPFYRLSYQTNGGTLRINCLNVQLSPSTWRDFSDIRTETHDTPGHEFITITTRLPRPEKRLRLEVFDEQQPFCMMDLIWHHESNLRSISIPWTAILYVY
ncbi:hypothetical protein TNCV_1364791 [Trichonephila clavipes]|nr:hypothetical protein TNCV_1364791 [Trichonephila clavipes]